MSRHLAISDIHGCFKALKTLCGFVELRDDDIIIPLGDYVDRGPNTYGVIDFLLFLSTKYVVHPLRGNHDIMMLKAREGEPELRNWIEEGGAATLESYAPLEGIAGRLSDVPEHHWEFLSSKLLPYFETDTHFFVHANAHPGIPLCEQPDYMLYWERFDNPPPHESGKTMICGHTSQKSGLPINHGHAICIDTRVYDRGWLTCLEVESGNLWQANEQGETRTLSLEDL